MPTCIMCAKLKRLRATRLTTPSLWCLMHTWAILYIQRTWPHLLSYRKCVGGGAIAPRFRRLWMLDMRLSCQPWSKLLLKLAGPQHTSPWDVCNLPYGWLFAVHFFISSFRLVSHSPLYRLPLSGPNIVPMHLSFQPHNDCVGHGTDSVCTQVWHLTQQCLIWS